MAGYSVEKEKQEVTVYLKLEEGGNNEAKSTRNYSRKRLFH
jgi:hypothetical protein